MAEAGPSRPPAIKLKLSLGGPTAKATSSSSVPSTPSGQGTASRKGQHGAVHLNEPVSKRKGKGKESNVAAAAPATPLYRGGDADSDDGDSGHDDDDYEDVEEGDAEPHTPLPSSRVAAASKKSAKGSAKGKKAGPGRPPGKRKSAIPSRLLSVPNTPQTPVSTSSTAYAPDVIIANPFTPGQDESGPSGAASPGIKDEPMEVDYDTGDPDADPLSRPLSPSVDTPEANLPYEAQTPGAFSSAGTPLYSARGRTAARQPRPKKPLRDFLPKILAELRKKDEYALFEEPVNPDDFPGYLDIVGGEEAMMDLGTMQSKFDDGEYRTMGQFEGDLRKLVEAAQKFNPAGTIPHTSAGRMLTHGLKHIERARPSVLTPSPSPTRHDNSESGTPWRGQSTFSGREMTVMTEDGALTVRKQQDLTPQQTIPEEMLRLPPNSLEAYAVGWNLTGGRREYAKRLIRAREKFPGKWRHWALDGSRDLAEMEDIDEVFADYRTTHGPRRIVDWKGMRKDGTWWDWGGFGGPSGQPPVPFTTYPRKPPLRTRELAASEWGVYPEIEAEIAFLTQRAGPSSEVGTPEGELDVLADHLRPARYRPKPNPSGFQPGPSFVNLFDTPNERNARDWLGDVMTGDVRGEAYIRSLDRFVQGAVNFSKAGVSEATSGLDSEAEEALSARVIARHSEVLDDGAKDELDRAVRDLVDTLPNIQNDHTSPKGPLDRGAVRSLGKEAWSRLAIRQLMRTENALDIAPLLKEPADFVYLGIGKKVGTDGALQWVAQELQKQDEENKAEARKNGGTPKFPRFPNLHEHSRKASSGSAPGDRRGAPGIGDANGSNRPSKRSSPEADAPSIDAPANNTKRPKIEGGGSSPLTDPPASPKKEAVAAETSAAKVESSTTEEDRAAARRRLRLELLSLSKSYPLSALKKMDRGYAEKMLPTNVVKLMSRPS